MKLNKFIEYLTDLYRKHGAIEVFYWDSTNVVPIMDVLAQKVITEENRCTLFDMEVLEWNAAHKTSMPWDLLDTAVQQFFGTEGNYLSTQINAQAKAVEDKKMLEKVLYSLILI